MVERKNQYGYDELIACAKGTLFGPGHAQLPLPNMLMFDEINRIEKDGGRYGKGFVEARMKVQPDQWFFQCHFEGDPVMPGCLGLDALWQLGGFFLTWSGYQGKGRALGVGEVKFTGQILPSNELVQYQLDIKRLLTGKLKLAIADGRVLVDGKEIYVANGLRVGIFSEVAEF